MRFVIAVATFAALTIGASAQSGGPAGPDGGFQKGVLAKSGVTRSGYEIPGCANYENVGGHTRQVCHINDTSDAKRFYQYRERYISGGNSGDK